MPRNIFSAVYSFSIMLFFENSFSKASGVLFIFIHVSMCHAHFCRDKIQVSWGPERPTPVFVSSRMPEKLDLKSMAYIGCFYNLMICSRGCRKTYTHTYMHTHFFFKTILGNQVPAVGMPGLKKQSKMYYKYREKLVILQSIGII